MTKLTILIIFIFIYNSSIISMEKNLIIIFLTVHSEIQKDHLKETQILNGLLKFSTKKKKNSI